MPGPPDDPTHPIHAFPGYRPVRLLYDSDHGGVWEVIDRDDGRHCALKYVRGDADPTVRAGLVHEGRLHGTLRHPGVAKVIDLLDSEAGHVALVTELVGGPSLADILDTDGAPDLTVALPLFEDVVRAVRAVHAKGIVHRDIKPENIVLRVTDGQWQPVLIDFGLAKQLSHDGVAQPKPGMSLWFSTLGTPEYMAPEQATAPSEVDERADLFSLGCLLYELLTGRVAFDAEDPAEAMAAVRGSDYVPPVQLGVPEGLAQIIDALLSPEPDDRPAHCTAILRRLDGSHG